MPEVRGSAFPEFLKRQDLDNGTWEVQPSASPRTNIHDRKMLVPLGRDPHSRVVRARELMRAKVGVDKHTIPDEWDNINPLIVDSCEEFRLNTLLKHAKISPDDLDTRHLPIVVDRAIAAGDVLTLADAMVRSYGTKANDTVARAIRVSAKKHKKPGAAEFAKQLRKAIRSEAEYWSTDHYKNALADTDPYRIRVDGEDSTIPWGYRYTLSLAHRVTQFLKGQRPGTWGEPEPADQVPEGNRPPEQSEMPDTFAVLSLEKLHLTERVAGRMGRKRSATNMGINPRRIHRYLVDPEKRIFDKRIKGIGGVVLIDQSGSMSLDTDDIWAIIKASPGATIIGYSHGPGSRYNCWVLAENGKVVAEVREGNGGNGVDGPALMFALSKRKKGEPLIWVCDGHVTDRHDACHRALTDWCAKVVLNHGVYMAEDVPEAVDALKQVRDGRKLPMRAVGPIQGALARLAAHLAA